MATESPIGAVPGIKDGRMAMDEQQSRIVVKIHVKTHTFQAPFSILFRYRKRSEMVEMISCSYICVYSLLRDW